MFGLYEAFREGIIPRMMLSQRLDRLLAAGRSKAARIAVSSILLGHLFAAPLFAQRPVRQMPDEDSGMAQWGLAVGIGVIVCLSAFLNSKRSHLS